MSKRYLFLKGLVDRSTGLLCLIILSPLLIFVYLLILFRMGLPVIFLQERAGLNEQTFTIYKFRTMSIASDVSGAPLPDSLRTTRLGRLLRASSIDELPSLFNIIRGEMSFVGPRPLLVDYLPIYSSTQRQRHNVLPGLTGLAQVNGRNELNWNRKLHYDVEYVHNASFLLDLSILAKTLFCVLTRTGITAKDGGDTPRFNGHN